MWIKKCKDCWKPKNHDNPLISRCRECTYKKSYANPKQTRIQHKSKTNKNVSAKFSSEIKALILVRDRNCIVCNSPITDYHHIYYGWQAEYGVNRNDINKWVGLCRTHHEKIHHFSKNWESQKLRKYCIDYINNL